MTISIESATAEFLPFLVTTTADPTGALPGFAVGTGDSPGAFLDGSWDGAWNSVTGEITALSPLVGDGQTLDTPQGLHKLWMTWAAGTENPVIFIDTIDSA